jgi:aminoglycoside phosphotransferase (APT) family kinase protein
MLVRMPSSAEYAEQVEKEHVWLPKLSPFLPLAIPRPVKMGKPTKEYPWNWSIYSYLPGVSLAAANMEDPCALAKDLAEFLIAFEGIDPKGGPLPGPQNFYRGGSLTVYDEQARHAISILKDTIDTAAATKVWESALETNWQKAPVWVHGDISAGNLLVYERKLSAVIDFGQLSIGDPACDLSIAWTFFSGESRDVFCSMLPFDEGTWARARGWTFWKALIVAAGLTNPHNKESAQCFRIIREML